MKNIYTKNNGEKIDLNELNTEEKYKLLSEEAWAMKAPINEDNDLIKPKQDIMEDIELAKELFKSRNKIYGKLKGDMIKNIVNIECKSEENLPEILEFAIELTIVYDKSPDLDLYFIYDKTVTKNQINKYRS